MKNRPRTSNPTSPPRHGHPARSKNVLKLVNAWLERPLGLQLAVIVVLLLSGWLRLHGVNWDEGHHLHPDERFLSTVTNDMKWPSDLRNYFDPKTSSLSPYALP